VSDVRRSGVAVWERETCGKLFPFESVSRAHEIGQSVANRSVSPKGENPWYGVVALTRRENMREFGIQDNVAKVAAVRIKGGHMR
jgi:hypothetical protein